MMGVFLCFCQLCVVSGCRLFCRLCWACFAPRRVPMMLCVGVVRRRGPVPGTGCEVAHRSGPRVPVRACSPVRGAGPAMGDEGDDRERGRWWATRAAIERGADDASRLIRWVADGFVSLGERRLRRRTGRVGWCGFACMGDSSVRSCRSVSEEGGEGADVADDRTGNQTDSIKTALRQHRR